MELEIPPELAYVVLLFGLFVVPRMLQRFRIPAAITSLGLGALAGPGLGLFAHDATVALLSTLGIVSLFLFAGLDVNVVDLRRERRTITEHLIVGVVALLAVAAFVNVTFEMQARPALLVSLALLTPSTGFILDSLPALKLPDQTSFWVRTKAIASELVALAAMFFTLQSATAEGFLISSSVMVGMILLLPILFRGFAHFVVPYAPKTEFAFLLMVAVICALVTRQLGVYYLVGAFVVGMVAQQFREQLPAIASEKMLDAVEAFASIFVPFYFFHAGLVLRAEDFSLGALLFGLGCVVVGLPFRILLVSLHRRIRLRESFQASLAVGVPMLPTLVFTLVIAGILRERFPVPPYVFGGLVIYTLIATIIPAMVFRTPPPEFENPQALPLGAAQARQLGLTQEPPERAEP